jgi:transposase-like protein
MRKHYAIETKVKAVLELLKEEKTLGQLAAQYEVHVSQLRQWRQTVLTGLPSLFSAEKRVSLAELRQQEEQQQALYAEIGRLTTELTWLKKKGSH